jgi:tetratricopeptide (TPR) repeat protein
MLENGQVLAARYVLLRKLGAGRWGEVWLARDREQSRDRALKILAPDLAAQPTLRARFLDAARWQGELRHPHVLVCDGVQDGDPCFAVLEYCSGGDLAGWRGRPWTQLVGPLDGIAEGLTALHARGWVHRDLKPSNVLLDDAGRVLLSDLGVAARIGERETLPPGSPFGSSPQQLDGEPPVVADDVYGFGALAYELLSGYPPYYPDAAAARTSAGPPAPIRARVAVPAALERLVLACLSRSAAERPPGMDAVRAELAPLTLQPAEVAAAAKPPFPAELRPPQEAPAPIEPRWQRPTAVDRSDPDLHSQGFRRGIVVAAFGFLLLAAVVVFFALPRWVQQRAPATAAPRPETQTQAAATQAAAEAGKARDLKRLAELKREFEELLPGIKERFDKLTAHAAAEWGGESFERARRAFGTANERFGEGDYESALAQLKASDPDLKATETAAPGVLRTALASGSVALESGTAADAVRHFSLALKLQPEHPQAKRGLARAQSLDEVRRLIADAEQLEREGHTGDAATAYRKALGLDPDSATARQALARLQSAASNAAFTAAMSQGLGALSRGDLGTARAAFGRAAALRPGAPEARDGLEQVARAQGDVSIGTHLSAAQQAEREERWKSALEEYRRALAIDPNLLAAQQGVERAEPRAALDAQLSAYAARPERLFSTEVRAAARNTLGRARAIDPPGPALRGQIDAVAKLVEAAELPVSVELTSDAQTEVTIYRIGKLGVFERKDMELLPGRYTVVGTRSGFRDVRRELMVMPGQAPPPLAIRCEEPI